MQLMEAIIEQFEEGLEPEAVALRAVVQPGDMVAEFNIGELQQTPYVIVMEGETRPIYDCTNFAVRVTETPFNFRVFSDTREECMAIIEALDNCYQTKILSGVDNREVLERPEFVSSEPVSVTARRSGDTIDKWVASIQFKWCMQKSF